MKYPGLIVLFCLSVLGAEPCRIDVVEEGSGWPVPLVELRTTHGLRWVSDNNGVIACDAPELMGREVWFELVGHGYEVPKDGFGNAGVRLYPEPGKRLKIEVKRQNIARRLGRITGGGIFAESQKLGTDLDWKESGVFGCDSVVNAVYGGRMFWAWGDTSIPQYPLGIFDASSATTAIKPLDRFEPPIKLKFDYFRDAQERIRGVATMPGTGPTWLTGYATLPDQNGKARLVATYLKIEPPLETYESGLCVWNDQKEIFEQFKVVWSKKAGGKAPPIPEGHPALWRDAKGEEWILFGNPFPTLRCRARFEDWADPVKWEVLKPQGQLESAAGGEVKPHSGHIMWSGYRKRWIAVFMEAFGKPSVFGELWYAESNSPDGKWGPAVKILTHQNYTFYNPRLHPEFTDIDSPVVVFEGTYTAEFADKPHPTARHNYNQVLYRLDLDDAALRPAQTEGAGTNRGFIRVEGKNFAFQNGERFVPWGFNYDRDYKHRLLEEYWQSEWEAVAADFEEMKELGANLIRIHLQLGAFMDSATEVNEGQLARLERLMRLAEKKGLYLDLTGLGCYDKGIVPRWYDELEEGERWAVQARFWEAIAVRCKDSTAVFCYDLMNEPIVTSGGREKSWLPGEPLGRFHYLQRINLDSGGREANDVAKAWVDKLVAAIRRHDTNHLITVGAIPWVLTFPGAKPLFYSREAAANLDFVSVHVYPKSGEIDSAVRALNVYDIGKPILIEEMFPLNCSLDELTDFVARSHGLATGWLGFYWGKTIAEYSAQPDRDLGDELTLRWLEYFRRGLPEG